MNNKIVRECDKCKKEDSINSFSGLCPSCETEEKEKKIETLQKENEKIRTSIDNVFDYPVSAPLWMLINELINNEIEQEKECGE